MPHIHLPNEFPGIRSLFVFRPETAAPLNALVQTLLHNPQPHIKRRRARVDSNLATAREQGATDMEIHDTVSIAAAFCMYNQLC